MEDCFIQVDLWQLQSQSEKWSSGNEAQEEKNYRFCEAGCIEDEMHIFLECTQFEAHRELMRDNIENDIDQPSGLNFCVMFGQ